MPEPRDIAIQIIAELRDAGHEALFAGGCVRDELLGQHPKDYDVATDAPPKRVESLFQNTRAVGKAFGVMQVRRSRITVEVATFRTESGYSDNRRPDAVEFCDAKTDAHRRDFTINAIFIDPLDTSERETGRIIDYVNGLADIEARTIRAVGDPDARLAEDDLRALRAVRFAARFGFSIDEATKAAITRHARELAGVSHERIGDELRRMLAHESRGRAVELFHDLSLDGPILNDASLPGMNARLVSALEPDAPFEVALGAWALDRAAHAEPGTPPSRWRGGGAGGAGGRIRRAVCLSNEETDRFRAMLELLERFDAPDNAFESEPVAAQKRALADPAAPDASALLAVQSPNNFERLMTIRDRLANTPSGIAPEPFVDGADLIALGYAPGPPFKPLLAAVYDAQLEDRVASREEALALVPKLVTPDKP